MARQSGRRPARAGIALVAISLTVAGCSQALPLGQAPDTQHHLTSEIVLQVVVSQPHPRQAAALPVPPSSPRPLKSSQVATTATDGSANR
jgi:hypothetical protein